MNVNDVRNYFITQLKQNNFTTDRTGAKTIELLGASFLANEESIFGIPNKKYIDAEIAWYESQVTNINELANIYGSKPAAWKYSANESGEINSNYGYLIYSQDQNNQFLHVVQELYKNPDTRRACMVYNRPSIWNDYCDNGKNDFICTNAVTYYVRDNKLHSVVQMRSNDSVFGYKNDYAWQRFVMRAVIEELARISSNSMKLDMGDLYWQVQNLHVYERHFNLVK